MTVVHVGPKPSDGAEGPGLAAAHDLPAPLAELLWLAGVRIPGVKAPRVFRQLTCGAVSETPRPAALGTSSWRMSVATTAALVNPGEPGSSTSL